MRQCAKNVRHGAKKYGMAPKMGGMISQTSSKKRKEKLALKRFFRFQINSSKKWHSVQCTTYLFNQFFELKFTHMPKKISFESFKLIIS